MSQQYEPGYDPDYYRDTEDRSMSIIAVKVTATKGETWTTDIQGPFAKAKAYFLGQEFNVGQGGQDKMVIVTKVELITAKAGGSDA